MRQKYDFGERKVTVKKSDNLLENTELKEQYDFVTENAWASVAKFGADIANQGYKSNMLRGAGAGAVIGGVSNVAKNIVKRDDDPTKKGVIRSMIGGASAGATTGAVVGAGARFAARTSLGKSAIRYAGEEAQRAATSGLTGAAAQSEKQKVINYMNSGKKAGWFHGGNYTNRNIGWNDAGELRKNTKAFGKGWKFDGDLV